MANRYWRRSIGRRNVNRMGRNLLSGAKQGCIAAEIWRVVPCIVWTKPGCNARIQAVFYSHKPTSCLLWSTPSSIHTSWWPHIWSTPLHLTVFLCIFFLYFDIFCIFVILWWPHYVGPSLDTIIVTSLRRSTRIKHGGLWGVISGTGAGEQLAIPVAVDNVY